LLNNAIVYEDDLEISPGAAFRLNGAIITNSNLLITSTGSSTIDLFLISGQNSCYYKQENSKILVAGNVVNGSSSGGNPNGTSTVHLFQGSGATSPPITSGAETTINTTNRRSHQVQKPQLTPQINPSTDLQQRYFTTMKHTLIASML